MKVNCIHCGESFNVSQRNFKIYPMEELSQRFCDNAPHYVEPVSTGEPPPPDLEPDPEPSGTWSGIQF